MLPRMAEFHGNPNRIDPYKNFPFRLKWDGKYVAGASKVTGLKRSAEAIKHREGGDPTTSHKSPGKTKYDAIKLERGLTQDPAFADWANLPSKIGSDRSQNELRKDIVIELYNDAGQLEHAYHVYRCWPSEYEAASAVDANEQSVAFERITLQNEGWERDTSVLEPAQA